MYMIGELMGLPEEDHAQLLHWSDLFATGGEEIRDEVVEAVRAYSAYILEPGRPAARRDRPRTSSASIVNADDEQGPLSDIDLVFETMLVLVGGDETTRHVISGGVEALLRHPDQLARLRAEPALLPGAIEEMLRWVSPIRNMNRTATVDVEVNGQQVKEGDRILLLYPSANRDETVFADPYRFDITRTPNDHVVVRGVRPPPLPRRSARPARAAGAVRGAAGPPPRPRSWRPTTSCRDAAATSCSASSTSR